MAIQWNAVKYVMLSLPLSEKTVLYLIEIPRIFYFIFSDKNATEWCFQMMKIIKLRSWLSNTSCNCERHTVFFLWFLLLVYKMYRIASTMHFALIRTLFEFCIHFHCCRCSYINPLQNTHLHMSINKWILFGLCDFWLAFGAADIDGGCLRLNKTNNN